MPRLLTALSIACLAGCVEPNHGSRIVMDLFTGFGPASSVQGAGTLANPHFALWGTVHDREVVRLATFDVVPIVDPLSPCLIYDEAAAEANPTIFKSGDLVMATPADDDPVDVKAAKAWMQMRVLALAGSVFAVTSASDGFPASTTLDVSRCEGASCWLDHAAIVSSTFALNRDNTLIPQDRCDFANPASVPAAGKYCLEPSAGHLLLNPSDQFGVLMASYRAHLQSGSPQMNPARWSRSERLRVCTQKTDPASPAHDPDFYVGNVVQLTAPFRGQLYGVVDGADPTAGYALGGISFDQIAFRLEGLTQLFVTVEDHNLGTPNADIGDQIDDTRRGAIVLFGSVEVPEAAGPMVCTADLTSPPTISIVGGNVPGGHAAIFVDLDRVGSGF